MSLFIQYRGTQPKDKFFDTYYKVPGVVTWRHGPIREAPGQFLIASAWRSSADVHKFRASDSYSTLLEDVRQLTESGSESEPEPSVYTVDFGNIIWWSAIFGPVEMRIVHFPATISETTRTDVQSLKGLTMPHGLGISASQVSKATPYRCGPICGWIDGARKLKGGRSDEEYVACLCLHSWTSDEHEKNFKETKRLMPATGQERGSLILEDWERQLEGMGALKWDAIHVDLKLGT